MTENHRAVESLSHIVDRVFFFHLAELHILAASVGFMGGRAQKEPVFMSRSCGGHKLKTICN